jgi:gentisate 1,2-dioxygenase
MSASRTTSTDRTTERKTFYDAIAKQNLAPLWEREAGLVTRSPQPAARPTHWRYSKVRASLLEAGRLLTAEEAERRVLILENPGLPAQSHVTDSLFSRFQLLMPGERAHEHRHVASALRVFLEGSGAYTAVNGERTSMKRGDFVITPSWTWHDHGNDGRDPVIWLDGLDVPIVNLFRTSFSEGDAKKTAAGAPAIPHGEQAAGRPPGDCEARYAGAMLPKGSKAGFLSSPLINYRYARARESLATMLPNGPVDPCHGLKLRYSNPLTGGPAMPTISAAIHCLRDSAQRRIGRPTARSSWSSKATGEVDAATRHSTGRKMTYSLRPAGCCSAITRRVKRCFSVFPIAPRRKRLVSGAKNVTWSNAEKLAAADERHLRRHHSHELNVCLQRQ